jgi:hypothetical protein
MKIRQDAWRYEVKYPYSPTEPVVFVTRGFGDNTFGFEVSGETDQVEISNIVWIDDGKEAVVPAHVVSKALELFDLCQPDTIS